MWAALLHTYWDWVSMLMLMLLELIIYFVFVFRMLFQWRRHHRGRGGRLPPQPQAWGGIATPEMWDGTESEIDAAKTRNSLAAARTGDLL